MYRKSKFAGIDSNENIEKLKNKFVHKNIKLKCEKSQKRNIENLSKYNLKKLKKKFVQI